MTITREEMQRQMRNGIEEAKKNPEYQAALKKMQEDAKQYASQVKQIEEVRTLSDFFEIAREEADKLQRDVLLGQDAE